MSKYSSLGLPDGWFAACFSHELAPGSLVSRTLFDRQLVLFRTSAGEAAVFDAHCPHMGAHFGHGGRVEGETLRCPFHGFSFATDGSCVATPYETKIPPKCRAGRWPVRERDGVVLVWHHHAGAEPSWDIPAIDHEGWSAPRTRVWRLPTHPQETSENSVDIGHFTEVHGYSDVSVIEPLRTEGPYLTSTYAMTRRGPGPVATRTHFKVHVHGLGYSFVEAEVPDMDVHLRHWVMCTPSEGGLCELRTCSSIRPLERPGALHPALLLLPRALATRVVARAAFDGFVHDVEQDFHIWSNKAYVDPPMLAQGDGPVGRYRKWCRQFYPQLPQVQARAS